MVAWHEMPGKGTHLSDPSRRGLSDFVLLRGRICAEPEGCSARSRGGFRLRADLKQKKCCAGRPWFFLGQFAKVKSQADQLPFGLNLF